MAETEVGVRKELEKAADNRDAERVAELLQSIKVNVHNDAYNLVVYPSDWALVVDQETCHAIGVMHEVLSRGDEPLAAVFVHWWKAHSLPLYKLLPLALKHRSEDVALLLMQEMDDVDFTALSSTDALHLAVKANMLHATRALLEHVHLSETFRSVQYGLNPLQDSLSQERDELIALMLLRAWPDEGLDVKDRRGRSLLHRAAFAHFVHVTAELLKRMPQDLIDYFGSKRDGTALHLAIAAGNEEIAMSIASSMSDQGVSRSTKYGDTALHLAAEKGMRELIGLLLSRLSPEDRGLINDRGQTAASIAAGQGVDASLLFNPHVKAANCCE